MIRKCTSAVTIDEELNSKGYLERGNVLSPINVKYACDYFKATSSRKKSLDSQHVIGNGTRASLAIDPSSTMDLGMQHVIQEVKEHMVQCFPKAYTNVESVMLEEIQMIMNQKGCTIDQDRHLDSFYDNLVMTVLLQTGHADGENGTLTLMSPREYMNMFTLSDALKRENNITQEEWGLMLVATLESMKMGLSQEGKSKDTTY